MNIHVENAIVRYRRRLEKALEAASCAIRSEALQDADEFLLDEVQAMDAGRLASENAAYDRFVKRFGDPERLAANYLDQYGVLDRYGVPACGDGATVYGVAKRARWEPIFATLLIAVVTAGGVCWATLREPPKVSPFTDVRFEGDRVFVTYDGHDYQWLELDRLSVEDIVDSAKEQFDDRWQKRVAEDLVEVLWGMDHRPSKTVRLRLLDPATKKEQVVASAEMTEANRRRIWQKRLADR